MLLGDVSLSGFTLCDWFPRAPGVYWSEWAERARRYVWEGHHESDPELGAYFSPEGKMSLIEEGGIGTVRLHPRKLDGERCWLATALTGDACHSGVPLAIPDPVLRSAGVSWGDRVDVLGRVRFLRDAGLDEVAASVHHARPLILFVDELTGVRRSRSRDPVVITPVALFTAEDEHAGSRRRARYTFVQCAAGNDSEIDGAVDWIEKYSAKYAGRPITNFDEQRPILADAPLSYQRLVARSYDRAVIQHFGGVIQAERIDQIVQGSVTTQFIEALHVGHKINVGGSAIINIDATLNNVTQTIGGATTLDRDQKERLEELVQPLKSELLKLEKTHAAEVAEITGALEKAVANAVRPAQERKKSILQLSAKGLKDAAELVKDVAPTVLTAAATIAKFIVGL
jgi:hypothetical protein